MTNSVIPYSFVPGTKAKAGEVNANFLALVNLITQNKETAASDILTLTQLVNTKADKESMNAPTVSESDTDLDDYKTSGTYSFSSLYTPIGIPKGEAGMLIVIGNDDSTKQIWISDDDETPEIFVRDFKNSQWGSWLSLSGKLNTAKFSYFKLPNGLIIQWGGQYAGNDVTFPIAFPMAACTLVTKMYVNPTGTVTDMGFTYEAITGFTFRAQGGITYINWIAFGY